MGISTTYHRVVQRYYFPNAVKRVETVVRNCIPCQQKGGKPKLQMHTLRSTVDGYPGQRWSIDLVGPLNHSRNGNVYILSAKDTFTRWVEGVPVYDTDSKSLAKKLYSEVLGRFGMPVQIHSDQGPNLISGLMSELYRLYGIRRTDTPAYSPKSNPVERAHSDIKRVLKAMMAERSEDD